jgi:VanZ family protein
MIEKIKAYKFSILWAVIMFIGCTMKVELPVDDNPEKFHIPHADKIVHFGIFCILAALIGIEKKFVNLSDKIKIVIISTLYGIMIEIIQYFIPWRGFDYYDMLADFCGAVVGAMLCSFLKKRTKKLLSTRFAR